MIGPVAPPPQLVPGRIGAIRRWGLITEMGTSRVLLSSIAQATVWPRGEVVAECLEAHSGSTVPSPTCSCGIYALHPQYADSDDIEMSAETNEVFGMIEAWGRIEVHGSGIRAEKARLHSLLAPGLCSDEYLELVTRAARQYGVDLVRIGCTAHLHEHVATEAPGLDAGFIEDLLMRDRRIVLEANTYGYISDRGRPVAGLGFIPEGALDLPKRFEVEVDTGWMGLDIVRVAGTTYRGPDLQRTKFNLGRELALVPEPTNPHDPNAIAVMDASRTHQIGYVPRDLAPRIGNRLAAGRIATVRSIWQWSDLMTRQRTDLHILISSTRHLQFVDAEELIAREIAAMEEDFSDV